MTAPLVVDAEDRRGPRPGFALRGGYYGRYLASGHLVYMPQGTLFAAAFDLGRLATTGQAVPALEGIAADTVWGEAKLAFIIGGHAGPRAGGGRSPPPTRSTG